MKRIILGTAGHIDHGKTTFIKALTGIDCDRLKEEKERGITIELGYAKLMLPSGIKVGIVDVPGHEKFVSKMVAGAAGIDVVALIIAADEGIKPQTREHLYICNLLGIKKGIVVITKKDLVDNELLELQKEDIKEFLKDTNLRDAPIVAVSSVTGEGISEFVSELNKIAEEIVEKPLDMPFRMPIDSVLTIKGFGTVVRGTVISGKIELGKEVVILPSETPVRIRGLQSHGENVSEGRAGERLAVNFSDIDKEELERGMVVAEKGFFTPTQAVLAEIHYLVYNEKPLKSRFTCQFHIFTSKVNATVYLLDKEKLSPGQTGFAMVKLDKALTVSYGDQYVMRGYGIYTTVGGGRILNPHIPTFDRKYFNEHYLEKLAKGDIKEVVAVYVKESKDRGLTQERLAGLVKTEFKRLKDVVNDLKQQNILCEDEKKRLYHSEVLDAYKKNILSMISRYHSENPLKMGINKDELLTKSECTGQFFNFLLSRLVAEKRLSLKGEIVSDINFKGTGDATGIFEKLEKIYNSFGLASESPEFVAKELKFDIKKVKEALGTLVKQGKMHKINDEYYITSDVFSSAISKLTEFFTKKAVLTPQDVRDLFGISRKYIIPFLEYLDSVKFTIRVPEGRKLRK